jgi:lysophospholipase L1-like esterase
MRTTMLLSFLAAVLACACGSGGSGLDAADADDTVESVETADPWEADGPAPDDDGVEALPDDDAAPDPVEDTMPDGEEDAVDLPGEEVPPFFPIAGIDDLVLYVNIGDSLAAGYNATGRNGSGGKGYARLMLDNHPDYPAYIGHFLRALWPDVQFKDVSESGAQSGDAWSNVQGADWPDLSGDVLVSLTCGGNDFNDEIATMISSTATEAAAAGLQANYREIVGFLRSRYEDTAAGNVVVFLVTNVVDPTAGTGAIPAGFTDGFCSMIQIPYLIPFRAAAISNLNLFNTRIAEVTAELGGYLVDNHGVFFDHGMNAPGADRWLSDDCVHPTNEGHHQLRREEWYVFTGERY